MEQMMKPDLDTLWLTMGCLLRKGETLAASRPTTLAWNKSGIDEVAAGKRTLTGPDQPLGCLQQALSGATLP